MSDEDIEATGHELWVPLPLDRDPDELYEQLLDRFGRDDTTADNAAVMVGAARQLLESNTASEVTGMQNLAGWALVAEPDRLLIRALATLRVVVLEADITATEVVRSLSGGETLFEEPVSQPIDTRSGEAVSVRLRPMVDEDGASRVHEVAAVLWPRPGVEAWYLLSTYSTDLVEAREIGELLDELGAGIGGL